MSTSSSNTVLQKRDCDEKEKDYNFPDQVYYKQSSRDIRLWRDENDDDKDLGNGWCERQHTFQLWWEDVFSTFKTNVPIGTLFKFRNVTYKFSNASNLSLTFDLPNDISHTIVVDEDYEDFNEDQPLICQLTEKGKKRLAHCALTVKFFEKLRVFYSTPSMDTMNKQ